MTLRCRQPPRCSRISSSTRPRRSTELSVKATSPSSAGLAASHRASRCSVPSGSRMRCKTVPSDSRMRRKIQRPLRPLTLLCPMPTLPPWHMRSLCFALPKRRPSRWTAVAPLLLATEAAAAAAPAAATAAAATAAAAAVVVTMVLVVARPHQPHPLGPPPPPPAPKASGQPRLRPAAAVTVASGRRRRLVLPPVPQPAPTRTAALRQWARQSSSPRTVAPT